MALASATEPAAFTACSSERASEGSQQLTKLGAGCTAPTHGLVAPVGTTSSPAIENIPASVDWRFVAARGSPTQRISGSLGNDAPLRGRTVVAPALRSMRTSRGALQEGVIGQGALGLQPA